MQDVHLGSHAWSLVRRILIPILGATTVSLNRPLATLLSEGAWVLVRKLDYSVHGGSVPSTKTIREWWPFLARDEYVSVRGDYVSACHSDLQLTLFGEGQNSGLRSRMTIHELQSHFNRRRVSSDNDVDAGNCLNATEIRIVPNSALSGTYRRPFQ